MERMSNEFDRLDSSGSSTRARQIAFTGLVAVVLILVVHTASITRVAPQASTLGSCPRCPDNCIGSAYIPQDQVDDVYTLYIVSDMDRGSKVDEGKDTQWKSLLVQGTLTRSASTGTYSVQWGEWTTLLSMHSFKGRGMELSELVRFDGRLLSFDDTTGIVYHIHEGKATPRYILNDGDGLHGTKGFKSEWATIKGNLLYVGSIGKEWTDGKTGEVISTNPQWVKVISRDGGVRSVDWSGNYNKLRAAAGAQAPGYMIHESGNWHERLQRWVFLPRRVSTEMYDEDLDERRAANVMLLATEDFDHVELRKDIGPASETHGFSAFRFLPNHDTEFVALKSVEDGDSISTYITVLNMDGDVLMAEEKIDDIKFEGLEIVP